MNDYFIDLASAVLYGLVGLGVLAAGYALVDLLTPGKLGHIMLVRTHVNGAIITGAAMLAVGAIVTTAIYTSDGHLGRGLAESVGYGLVGVILLGVAYRLIDLVTPGKLGDTVMEDGFHPVSLLIASSLLAVGGIVSASIT